jgi:type I restriction enzyme S subunit
VNNSELREGYKLTEVGVIPEDWDVRHLQDLVDRNNPIAYGVLKPENYVQNGVPLLQIRDVIHGAIDIEQLHRISAQLARQYSQQDLLGVKLLYLF